MFGYLEWESVGFLLRVWCEINRKGREGFHLEGHRGPLRSDGIASFFFSLRRQGGGRVCERGGKRRNCRPSVCRALHAHAAGGLPHSSQSGRATDDDLTLQDMAVIMVQRQVVLFAHYLPMN